MAFHPTEFRNINPWTQDAIHGQPKVVPILVEVTESDELKPEPEPEPEPPIDVEALRAELLEEVRVQAQAELAEAIAETQATTATLAAALVEVAQLRHQALQQAADDVGTIVIALSRRLLDQSLAVHPDALPALVRQALEQLPEDEKIEVHVAPGMMEQVSRALNENCKLVADTELGGGVSVCTRHVSIDASLEAAMNGVDAAVKAWLSEQPWVTDWMLQ
ncbi:MAG: hypothetical protein GWP91_03415 [Rhodobacterales bacterium]|nr:hypothetical protein [Rhodobacterales bacterium]